MAGSKNIIGRNRNIADRSLSRFEFRNAQPNQRKREKERGRRERVPDDRWTEREKRNAFNGRLVKGGDILVVVVVVVECRNMSLERGGATTRNIRKRGKQGRWKEGEKKRVEKSLGKKKSGIQARTHGIDGDEINMESVSRKIIVIKGVRAIHRETSFSGSSLADHRGAIGIGRQHRI